MKRTRTKLIEWGLILCMLIFSVVPAFAHEGYVTGTHTPVFAQAKDVKGHWAATEIEHWVKEGIVSAYEDGSFKPDKKITRAEFIAIANKAFKFNDAVKYISGYEDGTIKPNDPITRLEVSKIISLILKIDTSGHEEIQLLKDYNSIPEEGKGYVNAVVKHGDLKGYSDNTFRPNNHITRAEAVVSLYRAKAKEIAKAEEIAVPVPADSVSTLTGWILDRDCIGANIINHKKGCNLMGGCLKSGLGIYKYGKDIPTTATVSEHYLVFDSESKTLAEAYLRSLPADWTNNISIQVTGYPVEGIPTNESESNVPETDPLLVHHTLSGFHLLSIKAYYIEGLSTYELVPGAPSNVVPTKE